MALFVYPAAQTIISGGATESKQDSIIDILDLTVVDSIDTTPLLDVSATNIPASGSNPVEIVASTASQVYAVQSVEDIGEFIGIYTGAALSETLAAVLPLGGGVVRINVTAGTRISLRHMKNTAIVTDFISINFLG